MSGVDRVVTVHVIKNGNNGRGLEEINLANSYFIDVEARSTFKIFFLR